MAFAPSKRRRFTTQEAGRVSLTPMMDMMTIILLFLLKTYSVAGALLSPAIGDLPVSESRTEPRRTLSVVLTTDGLFEEAEVGSDQESGIGRLIVSTKEFDNEASVSLLSLESWLADRRELERSLGKQVTSRELTVQAARGVPYAWVLKLINAATLSDYDVFEFVVLKSAESGGGR
ncbi:MAG: biopolymer transporter ExbD [bacterium]